MYIVKNALRNITRTKGRNILIGIIVIMIAVSSCIALAISNSSSALVDNQMNLNSITATITVDMSKIREKMQSQMQTNSSTNGERPNFKFERPELTIDQIKEYGSSKYVKSYNYYLSTTVNSTTIDPYTTNSDSSSSTSSTNTMQNRPGGQEFGGRGGFENSGDFSLVGYSGQAAMTDFVSGKSTIKSGAMFSDTETGNVCVVSSEVAILNSLSVGDEITFDNPKNEDETFTMKVVGIYETTSEDSSNNFIMQNSMNPSNKIYTTYSSLNTIITASAANTANSSTDDSGNTTSNALTGNLNSSFEVADEAALEGFKTDLTTKGMSDEFTVTSDLDTVSNSLTPIKNLASFANLFLLLVLIVGGGILVILNMINIRERKYEIGVLTAIGMKKGKVAMQFITELFIVTLVSIIIGTGVGAALSVPTASKLLASQITSQQSNTQKVNQNFGGPGGGGQGGGPGGPAGQAGGGAGGGREMMGGMFNSSIKMNYVDQINAVVSLPVLFELLGIGVLLTLISGSVALIAISRYSPLKILSSRT